MYLDLSQFHTTPAPGKPFKVFNPKTDQEYRRLAEYLHVGEIEEIALAEGNEFVEREGLDPDGPNHLSRIYKATLTDVETGTELGHTPRSGGNN